MAMSEAERDAHLLPADILLNDWPEVLLTEPEAARFLTGLRRRTRLADAPQVRVYGPHPEPGSHPDRRVLLGSAHIKGGELIPTRLLSPAEVEGMLTQSAPSAAVASASEI